MSRYQKGQVRELFRFCNPVTKTFRDIVTKVHTNKLHLAIYRLLGAPKTKHSIVFENQFGKDKVIVGPAEWLAVPTSKNSSSPPNPKLLSHFLCYPVLTGQAPKNVVVSLADQWHTEDNVRVGGPVMFCNPALKVHLGKTSVIVNKTAHLICYRLDLKAFRQEARILNQFNKTTLAVARPDLLCVPSLKLGHHP